MIITVTSEKLSFNSTEEDWETDNEITNDSSASSSSSCRIGICKTLSSLSRNVTPVGTGPKSRMPADIRMTVNSRNMTKQM